MNAVQPLAMPCSGKEEDRPWEHLGSCHHSRHYQANPPAEYIVPLGLPGGGPPGGRAERWVSGRPVRRAPRRLAAGMETKAEQVAGPDGYGDSCSANSRKRPKRARWGGTRITNAAGLEDRDQRLGPAKHHRRAPSDAPLAVLWNRWGQLKSRRRRRT